MDGIPSNRKLMGGWPDELGFCWKELWFDSWSWYLSDYEEEQEVPSRVAVELASKNLSMDKWPSELVFLERFPSQFLVVQDDQKRRFSPQGWELVGIGGTYSRPWMDKLPDWYADQYLFAGPHNFLLIEQARHRERLDRNEPIAKYLSQQEATEWCIGNEIELPKSLEADCPFSRLDPGDIASTLSANTETVPAATENLANKSCDSTELSHSPSPLQLLTAGLSDDEMNKLTELIELERSYAELLPGKANPFWEKRYHAKRYQERREKNSKRNLAIIARQIFEAEKAKSTIPSVQ